VTRPHGTNTRGMERRHTPAGPKVNPFGTAAQTDAQRHTEPVDESWWTAPLVQRSRVEFSKKRIERQPSMKQALVPIRNGQEFN
jgi:hypothetical protein